MTTGSFRTASSVSDAVTFDRAIHRYTTRGQLYDTAGCMSRANLSSAEA
jgi:hypothetical protein